MGFEATSVRLETTQAQVARTSRRRRVDLQDRIMSKRAKCAGCQDGAGFQLPISMTFQPILNVKTNSVYAHEALVRGVSGESAGHILSKVSDENRYSFDQTCRVKAIEMATELGLARSPAKLSINFLPNAVYEPRACIHKTLTTAEKYNFPLDQILFEFTESEQVDTVHLLKILASYRDMGFNTAIDDFGAGYAGLDLLTRFQPNLVKIDMGLIRDIDTHAIKRSILKGILHILRDLDVAALCEGVETYGEFDVLHDLGVELMQGYFLGRPSLAALTRPVWPDTGHRAAG